MADRRNKLERWIGYVLRTTPGSYNSGTRTCPIGEQWLLKSITIRTSHNGTPQGANVGIILRQDKKGVYDGGAGAILGVAGVGRLDRYSGECWHEVLDMLMEAGDDVFIQAEYPEGNTIIRWNLTYEVIKL